ncbi:MAG: protein kinase [Planctomycetes bacterium]|nr:protein kinase [Planctomycetota bacterium]
MRHPNIVSVHEVGQHDGSNYIVSDYIQGLTLADWLSAGQRMDFKRAAKLCATITEAIGHAHQAGVIHRDLKPSNIMIDADGQPHVMDFGLAKREAGETTMTMDGKVLGTPAYMSPEQARGEAHHVDGRTDVFSLGTILFELLTGERPFRGNTRMLLHQVMNEEPPRLRSLNASIPRDLETICLKCLEKDPRRRYASAQEVADDLRRFLAGRAVLARPITSAARGWRWCARHRAVTALSLGLLSTLLVLAIAGSIVAIHQAALRVAADQATARANAETQRARTLAQAEAAAREEYRRELYLSDMNLVPQAWETADGESLQQALERHFPKPGEKDLRGFEWYVWRRISSRHAMELTVEGELLHCLAYAPNGTMLAVGDETGGFWTTDLKSGRITLQAQHDDFSSVQCVAFSPDGRLLAYGRRDGALTLWDVAQEKSLAILDDDFHGVKTLEFSPDGRLLAAGAGRLGLTWIGYKCPIKIWEVPEGRLRCTLPGHTSQVSQLSFSPDGASLASCGSDRVLRVWDLSREEETMQFKHSGSAARRVAFSPDGQSIASGHGDGNVRIWNVATGECQRTISGGHEQAIEQVAYSPDGKLLASGGYDSRICVWDPQDGRSLSHFRGHPFAVRDLAFSPDSQSLASVGGSSIKIWHMQTGDPDVLAGHTGAVRHVRFLKDQRRLISGGLDGVVQVWNLADGSPGETIVEGKEPIHAFALSRDEKRLAFSGLDTSVHVVDFNTKQPLHTLEGHDKRIRCLAFSPSDKLLISISGDKSAIFWDPVDGALLTRLPEVTVRALSASFSPDGTNLGIASHRCRTSLWDVATNTQIGYFDGHHEWVRDICFSPDGRILASASQDRTVRLWDVRQRRQIARLFGHGSAMQSLAFSPDGAILAAGDGDGQISLWDTRTFRRRTTLLGHQGSVGSLSFSPDGKTLASGGDDRTIRLWRGYPE